MPSVAAHAVAPTDDDSWGIARYAAWLRIAHHIPGRIRLKLAGEGGMGDVVAEVKRFVSTASSAPGIRSVSLNLLARSCLVEYDPAEIAPTAWTDLIAGTRSDQALDLTRRLTAPGHVPA